MKEAGKNEWVRVWKASGYDDVRINQSHFSASRVFPRHVREDYVFGFVEQGTVEIECEYCRKTHLLTAGSLTVAEAGEVFSGRAVGQAPLNQLSISVSAKRLRSIYDSIRDESAALPHFVQLTVKDRRVKQLFLNLHCSFTETATRLESDSLLLARVSAITLPYAGKPDFGFLFRKNGETAALKRVREYIGVREIKKAGERFEVFFDDGTVKNARKILLAFGVEDEFPVIENFADFWGKTVFHCPFCHGFEVRDRPLAVVGSGEAAVEMAGLLRSWSRDLAVCTNGAGAISAADRKLLEKHDVIVRQEKIVRFEGTGGNLENIVFETGAKLPRQGMLNSRQTTSALGFSEKAGLRVVRFRAYQSLRFRRNERGGRVCGGRRDFADAVNRRRRRARLNRRRCGN